MGGLTEWNGPQSPHHGQSWHTIKSFQPPPNHQSSTCCYLADALSQGHWWRLKHLGTCPMYNNTDPLTTQHFFKNI